MALISTLMMTSPLIEGYLREQWDEDKKKQMVRLLRRDDRDGEM